MWRLKFQGIEKFYKHSNGFSYIALLLEHPGKGYRVLQLYHHVKKTDPLPDSISPDQDENHYLNVSSYDMGVDELDERAKKEYADKLRELRDDRDSAAERGDYDLAEEKDREIELIESQLSASSLKKKRSNERKRPLEYQKKHRQMYQKF